MKTIIFVLTIALVSCAAQSGDENVPDGDEQENVEANQASLISTSGGSGTSWSASCLACRNDCNDNYPGGGGPLQTCLKLCTLSGKCTSSSGVSRGVFVP